MGTFEDNLRKAQAWRAQQDALFQADQAEQDYNNRLAAANQAAANAQGKKTGALSSVLSGVGNAIGNTAKGLGDFFASGAINAYAGTGLKSLLEQKDYATAAKEAQRDVDDFKKRYYNTDSTKDAYAKSGGTALEAASNIAELIPGAGPAAKLAINAGQGLASGIAQEYIDNGENASLQDALVKGGIGALASAGGSALGGKVIGKAASGNGIVSKAINSQLGRGATIGGISGAIGSGLETMRQGGGLADVLKNTASGAGQGALGGAAMAGTMGALSSAGQKLNDKVLGVDADNTTAKATKTTNKANELNNKQRAKLERQVTVNKQRQGAALLDQYGTLDKPTRRAVGSPEDVLVKLYDDYGLTTPADVQYASNHVTGKDGLVSQMTRELAGKAKKVNTSIDEGWLNEMMDLNGLTDAEAKTVTNQVKAALKRTTVDGYADGNTALDAVKQLEKQASRYKGKDNTYHNSTPSDQSKGAVLDLVRDELQGRIWDAAGDASSVMTPERIEALKGMYPDNQKWADRVDQIAQVKTGAELRSTMKPLVDGAKIVNGSKLSAGGFADRAIKVATSRNPAIAAGQVAADMALDSDTFKQTRADRYAKKAAKANAKLDGTYDDGLLRSSLGKITDKAKNTAKSLNNEAIANVEIKPIARNGNTQTIGDIASREIARRSGLAQAGNVAADAEIKAAQQEALNAQSDYNNAITQAQQNYTLAENLAQSQSQGQQQLDRISNAMQLALNAGDITSYAKLADLYQQAYKIYAPASTQTAAKNLTASQSKALTGMQQLEALAQMTPSAGTAVANSPLGFLVNMTGGDEYANQAKSLATTIGYLLSGATIKPDEAEAIGMAYVPTAFDSEQVRQQKLERARQLLQNYMNTTESLAQ